MCGRYQFDAGIDEQEIRDILQEIQKKYGETKPDSDLKVGEIFPTNTVPIVSEGGAELMRWGFPMHGRSQVVINARSETAFEKPMFRSALLSRRVVVPTTGFFEWKHQGGKAKDKYIFRLPSDNMLSTQHDDRLPREKEVVIKGLATSVANPAPHSTSRCFVKIGLYSLRKSPPFP